MSDLETQSPVSLLENMMLIRAYETKNVAEQAAGKSAGTCTSVGQEAGAVGVVKALGPDDLILTNHRSAGHLLARGADPGRMFAEVRGKKAGYCKGKSGNLHISVKELGVILTSTIVGGELSLATGVGLSLQMQQSKGIVVCFFGDGAACEGVFHESLNRYLEPAYPLRLREQSVASIRAPQGDDVDRQAGHPGRCVWHGGPHRRR
jgi:pyruvate dehydrogenase E1 component alpha subunit